MTGLLGWLVLGGVLAAVFVRLVRHGTPRHEIRPFAIGLAVAAAVYVVAAAIGRNWTGVLLEGAGLIAFGSVAVMGARRWAVLVPAGWALHVGWDVLLHVVRHQPYIGVWYPTLCVSFDLIVAGYVAWRLARPSAAP